MPVLFEAELYRQSKLTFNCRFITGCLKRTPLGKIFPLAIIALSVIRLEAKVDWERKQKNDKLHPMFEINPPTISLKSKKSFLKCTKTLKETKIKKGLKDQNFL